MQIILRAWLQTTQENLLSYRASTLEEKGENLNKIHQLKLKVCKSHRSWQRRPERQNNSVSPTFSSQSEKNQAIQLPDIQEGLSFSFSFF